MFQSSPVRIGRALDYKRDKAVLAAMFQSSPVRIGRALPERVNAGCRTGWRQVSILARPHWTGAPVHQSSPICS